MFKHALVLALLLGLLVSTNTFARDVKFNWLPNSETNLAGYKIHSGKTTRQYDTVTDVGPGTLVNGRIESGIISAPLTGDSYWAVTAYNTEGLESDYSQELTLPAATAPEAPGVMSYTIVIPGIQIIPNQ